MKMRAIQRLSRTARRFKNKFFPRAIILLYHRVIDLPLDPQLLCVSRRNFAEHLEVIRQCSRPIQLKSLGQSLKHGSKGECMVVVTFDDGYADNLYNVKPLLERYNVPATVFMPTGYLGSKREFWYDALERIFLNSRTLPKELRLQINGRCYEWVIDSAVSWNEDLHRKSCEWNIARKDDPSLCHSLYRALYRILHPLPDKKRREIMETLTLWAGIEPTCRSTHRTLSPDELISLADGGLVEIGSHTVSHPCLSAVPHDVQREEIFQSKRDLEEILSRRVSCFAYPFGGRSHYTDQTVAAVHEAGYEWACSSIAGVASPGMDRLQLPRFVIGDWKGEQFMRTLREWMGR